MQDSTNLAAVRQSALTALATDLLGVAFKTGDTNAIADYLSGSKFTYPIDKYKQDSNIKWFVRTIEALGDVAPLEPEDVEELIEDTFRSEPIPTNEYAMFYIGTALAYYSQLGGFELDFLKNYFDAYVEHLCFDEDDVQAVWLYVYLIYRLLDQGYFCSIDLFEMLKDQRVPIDMEGFVENLSEGHMDAQFLRKPFYEHDTELMDDSERKVARVLLHMTRVGTAYPKPMLDSTPRGQLIEIFASQDEDVPFLFGAMVTASEHEHCLVTQQLRERHPYTAIINESIPHFVNN